MIGPSVRAGINVTAAATPCTTTVCAGPTNICAQHCIPQPAAQGQPLPWPAGACELPSETAAHRLVAKGLAAAIDSGNSKACSATT